MSYSNWTSNPKVMKYVFNTKSKQRALIQFARNLSRSLCFQDELKLAKQIKQKSQYILNHIPKQFNCPTTFTQPRTEVPFPYLFTCILHLFQHTLILDVIFSLLQNQTQAPKNKTSGVDDCKAALCAKEFPVQKSVPVILFLTMDEFENVPK